MTAGSATESPQSGDQFAMTDLQEALQGPDGRAIAQGVLGRLDTLSSQLVVKLRDGVAQGQLEPTQRIYNALVTARGIMIRFANGSPE